MNPYRSFLLLSLRVFRDRVLGRQLLTQTVSSDQKRDASDSTWYSLLNMPGVFTAFA